MRKWVAMLMIILVFCIAIEIPWAAGWNDQPVVCMGLTDSGKLLEFLLGCLGFRWGVMLMMIFIAIVCRQSM